MSNSTVPSIRIVHHLPERHDHEALRKIYNQASSHISKEQAKAILKKQGYVNEREADYRLTSPAIYICGRLEIIQMLNDHSEIGYAVSLFEPLDDAASALNSLEWHKCLVRDADQRTHLAPRSECASKDNIGSMLDFFKDRWPIEDEVDLRPHYRTFKETAKGA